MFSFKRRVAYHETDAMGVVHHSNYVRYFEEARVAWMRELKLTEIHTPVGPYTFAVIGLAVEYMKSARFDDEIEVFVEGRLTGARIQFRYAIRCARLDGWLTKGHTDLVPLDAQMKPTRLPREAVAVFRSAPWSDVSMEAWPPAPQ